MGALELLPSPAVGGGAGTAWPPTLLLQASSKAPSRCYMCCEEGSEGREVGISY